MENDNAISQNGEKPTEAWSNDVAVIIVGDAQSWKNQGFPMPDGDITFVAFCEISEDILSRYQPTAIYSPLMGEGFDCIELAMLLRNLGYVGVYRAMATDLPCPAVIEREVSQISPALNFKISVVDQPKADTND